MALLIIGIAGCKKKEQFPPVTSAQVHAITREMTSEVRSVARDQQSIAMKLQFDGVHGELGDYILITLRPGGSVQSRRELITSVIQGLDRAATAEGLTRDAQLSTDARVKLTYRHEGRLTQTIEIAVGKTSTSAAVPPPASFPQNNGHARLAIVLDDLGNDRGAADAIFAMHYPLTLSVLPNHVHSAEISQEAHQRGYQIMLHLPMKSVGNEKAESAEVRPGMPPEKVRALVERFLQSVPEVAGVNNHQGSQSTSDTALMEELMPVLRDHNLFYIDSRTTATTVAYDTAHRLGVRSAFRNVPFLDDVAETGAVRKQLELALRDAREKGEAVAIGHPHPATLEALREVLPQARAQGVQLVFASELVH